MTWVDPRFAQWKQGRALANVRRRIVSDLEAYCHEPIQAIATRYWSARDREAAAPQPSTQDVMGVYETTDRYVYESSYLDFGGGAGGLTFALASAGVSCDSSSLILTASETG